MSEDQRLELLNLCQALVLASLWEAGALPAAGSGHCRSRAGGGLPLDVTAAQVTEVLRQSAWAPASAPALASWLRDWKANQPSSSP